MAHLVLVHGAWHGAWCWDRLVPALESRGHVTTTMDLPLEDGSATFLDYRDTVLRAVAASPHASDDLVVVGHSLGGMVAPLVAAAVPTRCVVFLCGVVPHLGGLPWDEAPAMGEDVYDTVRRDEGALVWTALSAATRAFYADCTPEDAAWAFARLRPFDNRSLWDRAYPLTAWPQTRYVAVTGVDDPAITAEYQRAVLRDRLGVTPVEVPGGHSPFLARPDVLAEVLDQLV